MVCIWAKCQPIERSSLKKLFIQMWGHIVFCIIHDNLKKIYQQKITFRWVSGKHLWLFYHVFYRNLINVLKSSTHLSFNGPKVCFYSIYNMGIHLMWEKLAADKKLTIGDTLYQSKLTLKCEFIWNSIKTNSATYICMKCKEKCLKISVDINIYLLCIECKEIYMQAL